MPEAFIESAEEQTRIDAVIHLFETDPNIVAIAYTQINCAKCNIHDCSGPDKITKQDLEDDGYESVEEWRDELNELHANPIILEMELPAITNNEQCPTLLGPGCTAVGTILQYTPEPHQ